MTYIYMLASDKPLQEKENPLMKEFSLNEAIKKGIEIDPMFIDAIEDPDEEGVVLWAEKEEDMMYPTFFYSELGEQIEDLIRKNYKVEIEGNIFIYPEVIINYVKDHLQEAEEIELWKLYLEIEDGQILRIEEVSLGEFDKDLLLEWYEEMEDIFLLKIKP